MSFANVFTNVVTNKQHEENQRAQVAKAWETCEVSLVQEAVECFRKRCTEAAQAKKAEATASFDVLSREIPAFPRRVLTDALYYVGQWPEGTTAESWYYYNKGVASGYTGSPVLYAEVLERMMPKFINKLQELGFASCQREAGTWKVTASWDTPPKGASGKEIVKKENTVCFAASLTHLLAEGQQEHARRTEMVEAWETCESMLLDRAVECFKKQCTLAAEAKKSRVIASFEALSRQIDEFPKRILNDGIYHVDQWPEGVTAESWLYANKGTATGYTGAPILYGEMLDRMLTKFISKLQEELGFPLCQREAGTWKVTAAWGTAEKDAVVEPPTKKARQATLVGGA